MKIWRLVSHHINPVEAAQVYKEEGFIAVGWGYVGDLAKIQPQSPQELSDAILKGWPESKNYGYGGRVLWSFLHFSK